MLINLSLIQSIILLKMLFIQSIVDLKDFFSQSSIQSTVLSCQSVTHSNDC